MMSSTTPLMGASTAPAAPSAMSLSHPSSEPSHSSAMDITPSSTEPNFTLGGRVLSIQSHTVSGYVGNKCAIFALQLLGFDVDPIHTVHLSNHTGFSTFKGTRMTAQEFRDIVSGLDQNDLLGHYSHILTGYVGNASVLEAMEEAILRIRTLVPELIYLCDPVLGDVGRLYVPSECIKIYHDRLIPLAHIVTPNQFEIEMLTKRKINSIDDALSCCRELHQLGPDYVVITSVDLQDTQEPGHPRNSNSKTCLTIIASQRLGTNYNQYQLRVPELEGQYTGTGDLFAALLLGWTQYHPYNFPLAMIKSSSTMQAILKRGAIGGTGGGGTGSPKVQLSLVQSRPDILLPPISTACQTLRGCIGGIIFDLDGTLTQPHLLNFSPIRERFHLAVGLDLMTEISKLSPDAQRQAHEMITQEEERVCSNLKLQANVDNILSDLYNSGISLAIATLNSEQSVHRFLQRAKIPIDYFSKIMTRESQFTKPHAGVVIEIAQAFDMLAQNILFIGDTSTDVECGENAGCRTCILLNSVNQTIPSNFRIRALEEVQEILTRCSNEALI